MSLKDMAATALHAFVEDMSDDEFRAYAKRYDWKGPGTILANLVAARELRMDIIDSWGLHDGL